MARKQRKDAFLITFRGETKSISEWARITGISRSTIHIRLRRLKWSAERALTEKPQPRDMSQSNLDLSQNDRRKQRRKARRKAGLCIECKKPSGGFYACEECRKKRADYLKENSETVAARAKVYNRRNKKEAISHYGTECECCGEQHIDFLTLDHTNNDGSEQRAKIKRYGAGFYQWLIRNNYPEDYELRVLCFNCNLGRRVNGGVCPHEMLTEQSK
jgi:transposase